MVTKKTRKNRSWRRDVGTKWLEVREKIIQRDNGKCVVCGKEGRDVHHKIPADIAPLLILDENNLVLLCQKCHRKQHPELPSFLFTGKIRKTKRIPWKPRKPPVFKYWKVKLYEL